MKSLLAFVGDYYPYPSSNTNCFDPLLCGLEENGWHVNIVTLKQRLELPNHEIEVDGREVWRIDDPRSMNTILQNQLKEIPAPQFLKVANRFLSTISKGLFFLKYCLFQPERRFASWSHSATVHKCLELHQSRRYDAVMSFSHPVVCHEIASEFLNALTGEKPKWFLYEFDPYCYNEHIYGKNCFRKLASKQHSLFQSADIICLIPELYDFYQTTPFHQYRDKMIAVNFPNMKPVSFRAEAAIKLPIDVDRINCVFGGALNNDIRNPRYALETFARCGKEIQWTVMTDFSLNKVLDELGLKNAEIRVYPMQSRDTSYYTMQRADILVNIGNAIAFQTPGKIFEYMAMGKPIIHFQKIDDDPCLKYFKNYPMVLTVNEQENTPQKHAKMIEAFCQKYKGKTLTFDEVAHYIPEYISKNVVSDFVETVNGLVIGR